jgi:hypothetical protein
MSALEFSLAEATRTRQRTALAHLGEELKTAPEGAQAAWAELSKELDLGPEPLLRACPSCGKVGMQAATRCGNCWVALTPP